jgi:hypothetical protein
MRHIQPSQLASGQSPAPPSSLPTVIGNISPRQLDTLDPIECGAPPREPSPETLRARAVLDEMSADNRRRLASLELERRPPGECGFLSVEDLPQYGTLEDLVRAKPDTNTLAQLVQEIEADPFRFALRLWAVETFAREMHDRVRKLENLHGKLR